MEIQLGQAVRDTLTGYQGIAVGRAVYLTSCAKVAVQSRVTADGQPVEREWIDEPLLEVCEQVAHYALPAETKDVTETDDDNEQCRCEYCTNAAGQYPDVLLQSYAALPRTKEWSDALCRLLGDYRGHSAHHDCD